MVLLALAIFKKPCATSDDRDKYMGDLCRRQATQAFAVAVVGNCTHQVGTAVSYVLRSRRRLLIDGRQWRSIMSCLLNTGVHLISDVVEFLQCCQQSC